jgi:hypothetical protein
MASLSSEQKAPAEVPTGAPSVPTIEEATVSFGFPAVCNDRFNYRLDGPIDLHCRISGLFESIDRLFDIAALLSFSFRVFAFHFSSISLCWRGADFPLVSPPFFCLFRSESEAIRESRNWRNHQKCLQLETKIESPLANRN